MATGRNAVFLISVLEYIGTFIIFAEICLYLNIVEVYWEFYGHGYILVRYHLTFV